MGQIDMSDAEKPEEHDAGTLESSPPEPVPLEDPEIPEVHAEADADDAPQTLEAAAVDDEAGEPDADEPDWAGGSDDGKGENEFLEIVKTIVYALGIALVLRILLFQPFTITSASMEPNQ